MKRRLKFELLIEDLHSLIAAPSSEDRRSQLWQASWGIARFAEELKSDPIKMGSLIGVLRLLRESGGAGGPTAEHEILGTLVYIAGEASLDVSALGESSVQRDHAIQVLQLLSAFALDCLLFKKRRDAYGGRRRTAAFAILAAIGPPAAIPGVQEIALSFLEDPSEYDTRDAIKILQTHFAHLNTQPDPE